MAQILDVKAREAASGQLNRVNLCLSLVLMVSPWALSYTDVPLAAHTAWISAIVIAVISAAATLHFAEWEEWINLFAGLWLIAAPWLLGFERNGESIGAFTAIGLLVFAISATDLFERHVPGGPAKL